MSLDIATLRCYTSIFDGFIYSDFGRLSGLEKSSLALILFDGISLKRGKKGGWKPVFKVNIYYLVSVLFAPNYRPKL